MLGPALKASILTNDTSASTFNFYFPRDKATSETQKIVKPIWCSMMLITDTTRCFSGGQFKAIAQDPQTSFDLAIRSGYIVPMASLEDGLKRVNDIMSTEDLKDKPITLYINPDCDNIEVEADRTCVARGYYYNTGDEMVEGYTTNVTFANFTFIYQDDSYNLVWRAGVGTGLKSDIVERVVIYNLALNSITATSWKLEVVDNAGQSKEYPDAIEVRADHDQMVFDNRN